VPFYGLTRSSLRAQNRPGQPSSFPNDGRCRAIAELAGMTGCELPKEAEGDMFLRHDIARGEIGPKPAGGQSA
jgi:hypothetical protein